MLLMKKEKRKEREREKRKEEKEGLNRYSSFLYSTVTP